LRTIFWGTRLDSLAAHFPEAHTWGALSMGWEGGLDKVERLFREVA
jgi:hypothetical protein